MAQKPQPETLEDYIPLFFARNLTEADYYQSLLEQHDIPVRLEPERKNPQDGEPSRAVSLLVPENCLADAQDIIEQMPLDDDDYDDEYPSGDYEDFDIIDPDFDIFVDEDCDADIEESCS